MNYNKLWDILWTCIYIAVVLAVVYQTGRMVYQYIQYGENEGQARKIQATKTEIPETISTDMGTSETALTEDELQTQELIRVQLLSQDYESEWHEEVAVTSDTSYHIIWKKMDSDGKLTEEQIQHYGAGECFEVTASELDVLDEICIYTDNTEDTLTTEGIVRTGNTVITDDTVTSQSSYTEAGNTDNSGQLRLTSFTRADGYPEYCGKLYLYRDENGIILVNELPLEEYLYSVVSSEIPSGYPMEAQKAQAVCARTYAMKCMERADGSGALTDLNDSVSWQVYNNYRSSEVSREAVDGTVGEVLDIEEALYYSTSCLSEHRTDLDTDEAFAAFLAEVPDAGAEYGSLWIRWNVAIEQQTILERLMEEYDFAAEQIDQIAVTERSGSGQAQTLEIVCGEQRVEVEGEYQIRRILSPRATVIYLSDGSAVEQMQMLPSAYFVLNDNREEMVYISGGGYGHGIGMSQCGAAAMAEAGADYREILQYYYEGEDRT